MRNSVSVKETIAVFKKRTWGAIKRAFACNIPDRYAPLVLLFLAAALVLPYLGERDLWLSAEGRIGQVSRQMMESGEWLVPMLGDDLRIKKPPMAYWLAAAASSIYGSVDEFSIRLPNALTALAAIWMVYLLGKRVLGRAEGLLAGLALVSTIFFWWQSRLASLEMPLLFLNLCCLYCWWVSRDAVHAGWDKAARRWLWLAYTTAGLAFLQKGPVGPLLALCIIVAYEICARVLCSQLEIRKRNHAIQDHLLGIAILLCVSVPWYLLIWSCYPHATQIWFRETAGRFAGFDHVKPFYFCIQAVLLDGQPWVSFVPFSYFIWKGMDQPARRRLLFPIVWLAVVVVFFSIPASKKHSYLLPAYPACAMLAGAVLAESIRGRLPIIRRLVGRTFTIFGILAVICGVVVTACMFLAVQPFAWLMPLAEQLRDSGKIYPLLMIALGCGLIIMGRKRPQHAPLRLAGLAAVFFFAFISVTPLQNRALELKDTAMSIRPYLSAHTQVWALSTLQWPVISFYLNRDIDPVSAGPQDDAMIWLSSFRDGEDIILLPQEAKNHEPGLYLSQGAWGRGVPSSCIRGNDAVSANRSVDAADWSGLRLVKIFFVEKSDLMSWHRLVPLAESPIAQLKMPMKVLVLQEEQMEE